MVEKHLIGPYILQPWLTVAAYLQFLNNFLGNLLKDMPLDIQRNDM